MFPDDSLSCLCLEWALFQEPAKKKHLRDNEAKDSVPNVSFHVKARSVMKDYRRQSKVSMDCDPVHYWLKVHPQQCNMYFEPGNMLTVLAERYLVVQATSRWPNTHTSDAEETLHAKLRCLEPEHAPSIIFLNGHMKDYV